MFSTPLTTSIWNADLVLKNEDMREEESITQVRLVLLLPLVSFLEFTSIFADNKK